jgi:hypothetical protein
MDVTPRITKASAHHTTHRGQLMVSPGSHSVVSKALHQYLCQTGKRKNTNNVQDFLRTFAEVRAQLCRANTTPPPFLTRPLLQERNTRMIRKDGVGTIGGGDGEVSIIFDRKAQ